MQSDIGRKIPFSGTVHCSFEIVFNVMLMSIVY